MLSIESAKKLMEKGWKARENFDFDSAKDKLIEAKETFEENHKPQLVSEALNHLAYTEKLISTQAASKALETALQSEKTCEENNIDPTLAYRAVISTAESTGNFELALKYAKEKMLPRLTKPILQGDLLSHIATFEMRTGNLEKATKTIDEALNLIDEGWESERDPHRSIWKVRALMAKALILHNNSKKSEVKKILNEAEKLAKEKELKPRIAQIESLKEAFKVI